MIAAEELDAIDAYWRAANYLTVGQIYLQENALLREPLRAEHVKPRLLGHWGTSPGLSLVYAHLNRVIRERDASVLFLAGPGHGGPAVLANVYLEGTYSEIVPEVTRDAAGMRALFRQFSTPGGVPSHVSPPTPGSIHEGGELGYVLSHAFGAVFDNPELVAVAVVGDGEAETGPLEGAWKGISFLNPLRDGAVLPVLHLNEFKISGPTVLGRSSDEDIRQLLAGHGYRALFVEGSDPRRVHRALAAALDESFDAIRAVRERARTEGRAPIRPGWPAIVLRTPKGWTGPDKVDGVPVEGTFRAHQVPLAAVRTNPIHLAQLEAWLKSYRPEELFDRSGRLVPRLAALAPTGDKRMGATPHGNGGRLTTPLALPPIDDYAVPVARPGAELYESTRPFGRFLRDVYRKNPRTFRLFCPDETLSNRLGAVFEGEDRCLVERVVPGDEQVSSEGRVMEVLSEHNCQGWLEGYLLTGRHGLFATYEAFALIVASMATQHAKWLEACDEIPWREAVPSLNYLLTSTCWRNDHNGFSHQGPGFMDTIVSKKGSVARVYFPPDANCLLSVGEHCLKSKTTSTSSSSTSSPSSSGSISEDAREHCARAPVWSWAGSDEGARHRPRVRGTRPRRRRWRLPRGWRTRPSPVRVVNVVDFMSLYSPSDHPHGMSESRFVELFTADTDVVFAFHGYAGAVHQALHGRPNASRFHVRDTARKAPPPRLRHGGPQPTSRYHLVMERCAARCAPSDTERGSRSAASASTRTTGTSGSTSRTCPRSATSGGRQAGR